MLFNPQYESANMIIEDRVILLAHYATASPYHTGFIISLDTGRTWAQYDLKQFGKRSPSLSQQEQRRLNRSGSRTSHSGQNVGPSVRYREISMRHGRLQFLTQRLPITPRTESDVPCVGGYLDQRSAASRHHRHADRQGANAAQRAITFDKTGTLTEDRPKVLRVAPLNGHSEDELLTLAAALGAHSNHPLARAIVEHAEGCGVRVGEVSDFQILQGKGVVGRFEG